MTLLEKKNNCSYFTFEHSHSYQEVQKEFLSAVSSLTPDDIIVSVSNLQDKFKRKRMYFTALYLINLIFSLDHYK